MFEFKGRRVSEPAPPPLRRARLRILCALVAATLGVAASEAIPAGSLEAALLAGSDQSLYASGRPRVVLSVIELGAVNMYHEAFHAGGTIYPNSAPTSVNGAVLREFGIGADHIIRLTRTGNVDADIAADAAQFDRVRPGEAYWYEGTNVIGVSFAPDGKRLRSDLDAFGAFATAHATQVAGAALIANPEAIIVAVQAQNEPKLTNTGEDLGRPLPLGYAGSVPADLTKPEGEEWAFNHAAVDIVSTSYSPRYNAPYGYNLRDGYDGVVRDGKIHVGVSDNKPGPITTGPANGPWWTIAVGGYHEGGYNHGLPIDENEYMESHSGQGVDVVGDHFQSLPNCVQCSAGYGPSWGNSMAAPRVAGTLSRVVLEARRAVNHKGGVHAGGQVPVMVEGRGGNITNWQLRRAMEETAYLPADDPTAPVSWDAIPGAPWLTHAWGAVSPDPRHGFVDTMLSRLGVTESTTTVLKPAEQCAYQTAHMQLRELYWNYVAHESDSAGTTSTPYIYC